MRITTLLGLLFFVGAIFLLTHGTGWRLGYIAGSAALSFVGLLLVSPRRVR